MNKTRNLFIGCLATLHYLLIIRCLFITNSNQYLLQLEKDISHHSRTVTAVINLCSLLQYDRDAGYDQVVKRELSAVKERLSCRWKRLCEKVGCGATYKVICVVIM